MVNQKFLRYNSASEYDTWLNDIEIPLHTTECEKNCNAYM